LTLPVLVACRPRAVVCRYRSEFVEAGLISRGCRPAAKTKGGRAGFWNVRIGGGQRFRLTGVEEVFAETERVILRPWRLDESDRFFDMHRRDEVARWLSGRPMVDRSAAVDLIKGERDRLDEDPRFGCWAIVERRVDRPAGSVLLKALPDGDGEIEIGWHLHPDSWGRGLATEAGGAVRDYGFGLGLNEIWAVTHLDNHASIRVCEKLGLRLLGRTNRWYHEPSLMFWIGASDGQEPSLGPDVDHAN
jgi:RimJ/RimL family protein N-acetyltransferase